MSEITNRPAAILDYDGDTWTPIRSDASTTIYALTTCVCLGVKCYGTEPMSLEAMRSGGLIAEELDEVPTLNGDAAIVARLRVRRAEALADMEAARGVNQTQFAVAQVLVEVLSDVLDG